MRRLKLTAIYLFVFTCANAFSGVFPSNVEDFAVATPDTIPLSDPYGDFLTDPNTNPFDIKPSNVIEEVNYDPETDRYIITEKMGEDFFSAPTYMTFDEYVEWRKKKDQEAYFNKLAGVESGYKSKSGILDPIEKIDIDANLVDRLFGGTEVDLQPQGNIDLTIGWDYTEVDNPVLLPSQRSNGGLNFDMSIKMNVDGQIGEKLNLGFNYDTQATFDFDRRIKLSYDNHEFSEDDIIKTIEAGNVSLPLRGSLIQGAQSLFGLKTEVQFGRLRLTGIASQQKSQNQNLQIENGSAETEFVLRPDEYDENRHFFLSHFHRQTYENSLNNLPYINTAFKISRIQVWVSDNRQDFQDNSNIVCAITDLGVPDEENFTTDGMLSQVAINQPIDPIYVSNAMIEDPITGEERPALLPDNRVNNLYNELGLATTDAWRRKDIIVSQLKGGQFQMQDTKDFQVNRARLLNSSEYTFNPELGFISLNVRLQPNQVLSVAYEYFYIENCEEVYTVGEFVDGALSQTNEEGEVEPERVIYTRMLKSTNQRTDVPNWDLMMKNVYNLNTSSLAEGNFEFDIFYENDTAGTLIKYIPLEDGGINQVPLLDFFKMDRLNRFGDPQQDGIFDFVPGVTVIPRNGSIIFPVLEPFGESIEDLFMENGLTNPETIDFFAYPELYDTTVVIARQEFLHKNKFQMRGRVQGGQSSEISLGAWNIPQGSVTVRAGSDLLVEGVDYDIDYGIGRLRILNPAYIQTSVPLNISFEDNSVFSFQQRTMLGLRADYEFSDNLVLGGTYMRLFERPFTQKVNFGDDPINNRVFGLDLNYSTQSDAITRIVDKLPFFSSKQPSSFNLTAEVAAIKPGHSRAINLPDGEDSGGVVSIDDFEGAISGFPLGTIGTNSWTISSTPENFPEGQSTGLDNGANRALLNWYVLDRNSRSQADNEDPYTRLINQQEIFNRSLPQGQLQDLLTFDVNYYPSERGPYNFDTPTGTSFSAGLDYDETQRKVTLAEPETRWAGMMRFFNNNDFQAGNFQSIDFWVLDPFIDSREKAHKADEAGGITFHLGNVSEDILNDNQQFFENTIPVDQTANVPVIETEWASVPLVTPVNNAFDNLNSGAQDLGLDGLDDQGESGKYQAWLDELQSAGLFDPNILADPANDNFANFLDPDVFDQEDPLFLRYMKFNNVEGNTPDRSNNNNNNNNNPAFRTQAGNPQPDNEDLNQNKSLDEGESYFEYNVPFARNADGSLDTTSFVVSRYYTDQRTVTNPATNDQETWYRFSVPLIQDLEDGTNGYNIIGGIQGFRSIQFMRMIFDGFETHKTFRFAELELVRNQWRAQVADCIGANDAGPVPASFSVQDVGIEENTTKQPFGYVSPVGIQREQLFSTFANVLQDEQSLSMNFCNFKAANCDLTMSKLTQIDLRVFERLQMFVHAEDVINTENPIPDGAVSCFIRMGKDFVNNYYEYEIPLNVSVVGAGGNDAENIWPASNQFDFPLSVFTELKKHRNISGTEFLERDSLLFNEIPNIEQDPLKANQKVVIKGNPNLAEIKGFMIGIRLNEGDDIPPIPSAGYCGEVWVNELRATGLQERGGVAGLARADLQIADLGNLSASGSYSSIGWGAIDQKVDFRQKEERINYDFGANFEVGKFLPKKWNISVPVFAQYSKSIVNPEFDPYDLDLTVPEKVASEPVEERAEILDRARQETTIRTINLTNVRKNRSSGSSSAPRGNTRRGTRAKSNQEEEGKKKKKKDKGPRPWNIENLSASYSYNEIERKDFLIRSDLTKDQKLSLYYDYAKRANFIQPFKNVKSKYLKWLKEFNFNPLPQSLSIGSEINRYSNVREYREPVEFDFTFNDQRFNWQRVYDVKWDLSKSLRLSLAATQNAVIDELRQVGVATDAANREWVDERQNVIGRGSDVTEEEVKDYWQGNIRDFGRANSYNQNFRASYTLPIKYLPGFDWVTVKAQYDASYNWDAGGLIGIGGIDFNDPVGNIIQNTQDRSANASLDFEKLYEKLGYFKRLEGKNRRTSTRSRTPRTRNNQELTKEDGSKPEEDKKKKKKEKNPNASFIEKLVLRPLLSLRKVDLNYRESFNTVVPGFTPSDLAFLGNTAAFAAPGLDFTFGIQPDFNINNPDNWLVNARDNGWLNPSRAFNQQLVQSSRQTFDAKVKLEPWKDVRIDVDFKKNFSNDNTQYFTNKGSFDNRLDFTDPINQAQYDFQQFGFNEFGSFEVSYFSLRTLFNDSDSELEALFNTFENNRSIVSQNLDPTNSNPHEDDGDDGFDEGFGRTSTDVLIPSFIAAYTGQSIGSVDVSRNLSEIVSSRSYIPAPNWRLSYSGLSRLDAFKDIFSSFELTHGYSNTLRVARFFNDPNFSLENQAAGIPQDIKTTNSNFFSRFETSNVTITERFDPIIGIQLKTKSEANLNFQWSKSRTLDLQIASRAVLETRRTQLVLGAGYVLENVNIGFLTGDKKGKKKTNRKKDKEEQAEEADENRRNQNRGGVTDNRDRRLSFNLDLSFSDDVTLRNGIDDGQSFDPTRGTQTININPFIEYGISKDFSLIMFLDYGKTTPRISTGFPVTNVRGGFTLRFNLN